MNKGNIITDTQIKNIPDIFKSNISPLKINDLNIFPKGELYYRGIASDHLDSGNNFTGLTDGGGPYVATFGGSRILSLDAEL